MELRPRSFPRIIGITEAGLDVIEHADGSIMAGDQQIKEPTMFFVITARRSPDEFRVLTICDTPEYAEAMAAVERLRGCTPATGWTVEVHERALKRDPQVPR